MVKQINKKAYYFSLDAFIALLIILGIVLLVKPVSVEVSHEPRLQEDLLYVLSSLEIGEIDNDYVKNLIANRNITDLNKSVLEQIGEFHANSNPEAGNMAENILDNMNLSEEMGIYFNGVPISTIGNIAFEDSEDVWTSRQIISGIQGGNASKGYSSRAFLLSKNKVDYFYFGGYVGDGNITVKLDDNIIGANIEGIFSGNFDLYINDNFVSNHTPSSNVPYNINLADSFGLFRSGSNYLDFRSKNNLYIAGGFIRVVYNSSSNALSEINHRLPGINGIINLYDSFYVPGALKKMEIFLSYNSPYNIFLNIGNTRVYTGNSSGSVLNVTLTNFTLSNLLNYADLSQKTIPLRLGLENVSYLLNLTVDTDVFSVTDLSGSMASTCIGGGGWCCRGGRCNNQTKCISCGGLWEDKIGMAKQANNVFIDSILNKSRNRVGLVGYASTASNSHSLSNDSVSLKTKVNSWSAGGMTCICCGINEAVEMMKAQSQNSSFKSLVVMSDGGANVQCSIQGTGNAKQDAIQAACDAYNVNGIKVYAIGFGSEADESTLQSIASCGSGSYYYGDINQLINIYEQVAGEIITASYFEQTVISNEIYTKLYPDSYVLVEYDLALPYGMIITAETPEFGNNISQGNFSVPVGAIPYEVRAVSYSGAKWTDKVDVYNNNSGVWDNIFNLSEYNSTYINLGDPYVVNIPINKINYGHNKIKVSTSLNSVNSSGGSPYNKIIYSLVKNVSSYSQIVASAKGCKWLIEFEDDTNSTMSFPEDYSGTSECYYASTGLSYNNNDAFDNAIFNLLSDLDLNSNRKIETKFSENDLTINSIEVTGIPFTWETEVQVRLWR